MTTLNKIKNDQIITTTDNLAELHRAIMLRGSTEATTYDNTKSYISPEWSPKLGIWVIGTSDGNFYYSSNGLIWSAGTSTGGSLIRNIKWSEKLGIFLASCDNIGLLTSSDGITWTTRNTTEPYVKLTWSKILDKFLVFGNSSGVTKVYTTEDGISLTLLHTFTADYLPNDICESVELGLILITMVPIFPGIGEIGIYTSTNGSTWTIRMSDWVNFISWSPELNSFCGVHSRDSFTSSDGISWNKNENIFDNNVTLIEWIPSISKFLVTRATLSAPTALIGSDGTNWEDWYTQINGLAAYIKWSPELDRILFAGTQIICVTD